MNSLRGNLFLYFLLVFSGSLKYNIGDIYEGIVIMAKTRAKKVNLSSKTLGEARKKAIKEAYIPKAIKGSCNIVVNESGDVTISSRSK